jgi:sigma-E factor negative regulatory protein RseB
MSGRLEQRRGVWRSALAAGVLIGAGLGWATAGSPGLGKAASATPLGDAQAVVRRIQDAAQRRSYSGTFVVNAGGVISSSRITHFADGRQQIERIEALDGQMRRLYRHNDTVHVFWPKTREASIEQRELLPGFPVANIGDAPGALDAYELQSTTADRAAGHEAQVVTLRPRDTYRYAQRLWLERQSGLLLRADTLGARGEVIESSSFSELQLDAPVQPQVLLQEMRRLDGYRIQRSSLPRCELEREGWLLRALPPSFTLVRCVLRPLRPGDRGAAARSASAAPAAQAGASAAGGPASDASTGLLQATFSDGLTLVSIFVEPFDASVHHRDAAAAWGATQALSRRLNDWWITAVGDVPLVTLQQFSSGMERRRP